MDLDESRSVRNYLSPAIFFLMIRRPPRSTLFPTRRSSDLTSVAPRAAPASVAGEVSYVPQAPGSAEIQARKIGRATRLNSSHLVISYAVFCLKKKKTYSS